MWYIAKPRLCVRCGKLFYTEPSSLQIYCSDSCKEAANLENRRAANLRYMHKVRGGPKPKATKPEKQKPEKQKQEKQKPVKPVLQQRTCKQCGKEFMPNNNSQKFCSVNCRLIACGRRADYEHAKVNTAVCQICGKTFQWSEASPGSYRGRKYCSPACRNKHPDKRRKKMKPYVPLTPEQIAALPSSPPGEVHVFPIESLQEQETKSTPTARIKIPVSRLPKPPWPATRNRASDGDMQKVLSEKELL